MECCLRIRGITPCQASAAPAGKRWLKLTAKKMEYLTKTEITLKVPLCAPCYKMRGRSIMASTVGALVGLVVGGVLVVATASLWNAIETQWLRFGIPIIVLLVFMSIGIGIGAQLHLKKLSPEGASLSTRLATNSVAKMMIGKGNMLYLLFENDAFVKQFQILNGGEFIFLP